MVVKPEAEESNLHRSSGGTRKNLATGISGHLRVRHQHCCGLLCGTLAALMKMAYLLSALAVAVLAASVQGRSCCEDTAVCNIIR